MSGVITGAGLGLFGSSANVLGGAGVLGGSQQGRTGAGARVYVNAVNGNLILQSPDEVLSGRGADLGLLRTYNLQGTIDSTSNGLGWSWDGGDAYVVLTSGALNATGSIVSRVTGDGHECAYKFNGTTYVSTVGDGAHDTLSHSGTTWTWIDGSTRQKELYGDSLNSTTHGRLQSRTDAAGNAITFSYSTGGLLTSITDTKSGQHIELKYSDTTPHRLTEVDTFELNVDSNGKVIQPPVVSTTAVKQVSYSYDASGRLSTVTSYLRPGDASSPAFVTAYAYEDTSGRVSSVTQNNGTDTTLGTKVEFTYEQAPGTGINGIAAKFRVKTVRDANGLQTFQYNTDGTTNITIGDDASNQQTWTYSYDGDQQLALVQAPAMNGVRLTSRNVYDSQGNLVKVIDARGAMVIYQYDANGNLLIQRDSAGNTVKRTYDANNQLLTETRYTNPDAGIDDNTIGIGSASGALTIHYVYDSKSSLRFVISAEGGVVENRYTADGLLERAVRYAGGRFDVSTLAADTSPSEAQMTAWVGQSGLDKTKIELTQYQYDFRGNLSRRTDFASTDSSGAGIANDAGDVITDFVYDGRGLLVHSVERHGTAFDKGTQTTFLYDGLNREISRIDAAGTTTTTTYDDKAGTITVDVDSTANNPTKSHLVTVSAYNLRGQLVSLSRADASVAGSVRLTRYVYDAQGRLQLLLDAQGGRHFSFYDAAGRLSAVVDSTGAVTGFSYNENGQLQAETHYANRLTGVDATHDANSVTGGIMWIDSPTNPTKVNKLTLVLGTDWAAAPGQDRATNYHYDLAGRLDMRTDALGTQTVMQYDGASRLTQQTTVDRVTRSFYDHDGRLVGVLDPHGTLTEYRYNAAGHLVETVRYNTRSPLAVDKSRPVWLGVDQSNVISRNAAGGSPFTYRVAAVDSDGDPLTFSVVGTPPAWLTVTNDSAGVTVSGTPPTSTTPTSHTVVLRANDGRGTNSSTADVTVNIKVDNSAPVWGPVPDFAVKNKTAIGTPLSLPVATDAESASSTLRYSFTNLPIGISFGFNGGDHSKPQLTGTPTTPGLYTVVGTVQDPQNNFTRCTFVIQVADAGEPKADPVPLQHATRTQPFTLMVPVVDPDGQTLKDALISKPDWLTYAVTASGISFSGTPPKDAPAGSIQVVQIELADPQFGSQVIVFPIVIDNLPPVWPADLGSVRTLATVNYTPPAATDPDGGTLRYELVDSPGLNIDPTTGRIFGAIPNVVEGATYVAHVRVTDSDPNVPLSTTSQISFVVDRTPTFNTARPIGNIGSILGQDFFFRLPDDQFIDTDGDPLTITASGMPPGITFSNGIFSGTPTVAGNNFNVTITAADPFGASVSVVRLFFVQVPLPPPPRVPPPSPNPGPGPRPPIQPRIGIPMGGDAAAAPTVPSAPLTDPPPPVLVDAPAVLAAAALPPPPLPITTLTPLEDVLATARPASSAKDLHSFRFYDGDGRAVLMVDDLGFVTETVFDEQLNQQRTLRYTNAVTATTSSTLTKLRTDAGAVAQSTTMQFDDAGRMTSTTEKAGPASSVVSVTNYQYDSMGRATRRTQAAGTPDERSTRTVYDIFGETVGTLGGEADAALLAAHPTPVKIDIDAAVAANGMRYAYDGLGRRTQATDGKGNVTLYYYDSEGNLSYTVNALGELSEFIYNPFGEVTTRRRYDKRLSSTQLATLRSAGGGKVTSTLAGMLPGLRNTSNDQTTTFAYDQRGQLKTETDAADSTLGLVTNNTYDVYGELQKRTRAINATASVATQFDYDLDGQLLSTTADVGGLNFNTQMRRDAFGRVVQTMDGAGRITSRTEYKDSGRTIEVKDVLSLDAAGKEVAGHMVHTEYDFSGRVTKVTDVTGKDTTYSYDDANRSMTVTTPEQVKITTVRTRAGETLSVTHGSSVTTYGYDRDGQLLTVTDALGNVVTTNKYDLQTGLLIRMTDARNVVTKLSYDAVNRVVERRVDPKDAVDGDGNTNDNPNGLDLVCTYAFDAFGQQVTVTEGHGNNTGVNSTKVTQYRYDQDGRTTRIVVDPTGLKLATTLTYDGLNETVQMSQGTVANPDQRVTVYVFDKLGRRLKEIQGPSSVFGTGSSSTRDLTVEFRYDLAGNMTRRIDAAGNSAWFVYDQAGRLTQTIDALGEVNESTFDARGLVVQTRRYVNRLSAGTVASFGDTVTRQAPGVSIDDARTFTVYDDDMRARFTLQAATTSADGTRKNWTISEQRYDLNGNVSETRRYDKFIDETRLNAIDSSSSPGITVAEMVTELTTLGYTNVETTLANIARTRFAYDAANRLRFTVDALGDVNENAYDNAGNLVAVIRYAGRPILNAFDANSINDAVDGRDGINPSFRRRTDNQVTRFSFDNAGRLRFTIRVLTSDANGFATRQVIGELRYDDVGHVIESRDYATEYAGVNDYSEATLAAAVVNQFSNVRALDRRTIMAYDPAGRAMFRLQVSRNDNSGQPTRYIATKLEYDDVGDLVKSTAYAREITTVLPDDKFTTINAAIVTSAQDRTTGFVYDLVGRQRFVIAADGTLSETVYDALNRVTEQRQFDLVLTPRVPRTEAALMARRAARAVGDGVTRGVRYTYDSAGRLLTTQDAMGFVETSKYDGLGNRTSYIDKNGNEWLYNYDRLGRVREAITPETAVQLTSDTTGPVRRKLSTVFDYDTLGNLRTKTEASGTADARSTNYSYDRLGRQVLLETAVYDSGLGRVITGGVTDATKQFNRQETTDYDSLGNVVRTGVRTGPGTFLYQYKTYDSLGRVIYAVDSMRQVTKFEYDVFGDQIRVWRFTKEDIGAPPAASGGGIALWTTSAVAAAAGDGADPIVRVTQMEYDALGRKISVSLPPYNDYYFTSATAFTSADGIAPGLQRSPQTRYDYTVFGEIFHESQALDDTHSKETWHYYDLLGRETRTLQKSVDALGATPPQAYDTLREYDKFGNLRQVTEFANTTGVDPANSLTPPTTPAESTDDRITRFSFDAMNRNTMIERLGLKYTSPIIGGYRDTNDARDVATIVSQTTYDAMGHTRTLTDALQNVTTSQYNELGKITSVTEPARLIAGTGLDPFVAANHVTASPVTTLTYNGFGQVLVTRRSAGGSGSPVIMLSSYDAAGSLISTTDGNHVSLDAAGHIVADHTYDKVFSYDYAGRLIRQTQRIVSQLGVRSTTGFLRDLTTWRTVDQSITRIYVYDDAGRRRDVLNVFKDANGVLQQSGDRSVFNAFGEVRAEQKVWGTADKTSADLSVATVATYEYDNAGRRLTMRNAAGRTAYYYDLAGDLTRQEARGNESTADGTSLRITEMAYDLLGRVVATRLPASGSPGVVPNERLTYDRWGNVTQRRQLEFVTFPGTVTSTRGVDYTYNADNQMLRETHRETEVMNSVGQIRLQKEIHETHYDLLGRVVEEIDRAKDIATGIESAPLRLHTRLYDASGNLTSESTGLSTDSAGIGTTEYFYDGFGNRVGTKNALGSVFLDSFDANGNQLTHSILRLKSDVSQGYVSGTGEPVAVLLNRRAYDQSSRLIQVEDYHEAAPIGVAVGFDATYMQYDERGFVIATFKEFEARNGEAGSIFGFGGARLTSCQYDLWGAKVREEDASHFINTWEYDRTPDPTGGAQPTLLFGRLQSIHVGRELRFGELTHGHITTYDQYNDFNQVLHEAYSGDDINLTFQNDRTYTYYANGLTNTVTDNNTHGNINRTGWVRTTAMTSYAYNGYGEIRQEHNVSSGSYSEFFKGENSDLIDLPNVDSTTSTSYDEVGRVKTVQVVDNHANIFSKRAGGTITYDYDQLGNRRRITSVYTPNGGAAPTTDVTSNEFDSEGRVKVANLVIRNGNNSSPVDRGTTITYDALGRRVTARTEHGNKSLSQDGGITPLDTGLVDQDTGSHLIGFFPTTNTYSWDESRVERYAYDDLGHLTLVEQSLLQSNKLLTKTYGQDLRNPDQPINPPRLFDTTSLVGIQTPFTKFSARTYNLLGQQIAATEYLELQFSIGHDATDFTAPGSVSTDTIYHFDTRGFLHDVQTRDFQDSRHTSTTTYDDVDDSGLVFHYLYEQGNKGATGKIEDGFTANYQYGYTYVAGALKQSQITVSSNVEGSQPGSTIDIYDARGQLAAELVGGSRTKADGSITHTMTRKLLGYDAQGRAIAKDVRTIDADTDNVDNIIDVGASTYLYAGGLVVGTIGDGKLGDNTQFGLEFTKVSAAYPAAQPGSHAVTPGDTLAGIARLYFGDPQLWYLIADANAVNAGPNDALPPSEFGRVYHIPNVITGTHNNAGTSQPYNLSAILGSSTPNFSQAAPGDAGCTAHTWAIVVGVAAQVVATIALGILLPGAGFVVAVEAGALGAAIGNTTQQFTEIGLSDDKSLSDFSGTDLARATFAGAAGGGIGFAAGALASFAATEIGGSSALWQAAFQAGRAGLTYGIDAGLSGGQQEFSGWHLLSSMAMGGLGGLLGPVTAEFGKNFEPGSTAQSVMNKFGSAAQALLLSASDPYSGWAWQSKPQTNWAAIASAAISAVGIVLTPDHNGDKDAEVPSTIDPLSEAIQGMDLTLSPPSSRQVMRSVLGSRSPDLPAESFGEILDGLTNDDPMPPEYIIVPRSLRSSEELGKLRYPDETAANQILGSVGILQINGVNPREVKAGQEFLTLPFDQYDTGKLRTLRNQQNAGEAARDDLARAKIAALVVIEEADAPASSAAVAGLAQGAAGPGHRATADIFHEDTCIVGAGATLLNLSDPIPADRKNLDVMTRYQLLQEAVNADYKYLTGQGINVSFDSISKNLTPQYLNKDEVGPADVEASRREQTQHADGEGGRFSFGTRSEQQQIAETEAFRQQQRTAENGIKALTPGGFFGGAAGATRGFVSHIFGSDIPIQDYWYAGTQWGPLLDGVTAPLSVAPGSAAPKIVASGDAASGIAAALPPELGEDFDNWRVAAELGNGVSLLSKDGIASVGSPVSTGFGGGRSVVVGRAPFPLQLSVGSSFGVELGFRSVDPTTIGYTQASVSFGKAGTNYNLSTLINSMSSEGWVGSPLDVVAMPDGTISSIDNTRVLASRYAAINAESFVHAFDENFTNEDTVRQQSLEVNGRVPQTWGEAAQMRINKSIQDLVNPAMSPPWTNRFPYGSIFDPKVK